MITDIIYQPFWHGFILGTSVYAVAGGVAYCLFLAGKRLVRLGASLQHRIVHPRRGLGLAR